MKTVLRHAVPIAIGIVSASLNTIKRETLKRVQGDESYLFVFSKIAVTLFLLTALTSCKTPEPAAALREDGWAKKVEAKNLNNLYKVDEVLYRSEQPDVLAMAELETLGIKTVLNLRKIKNDRQSKTTKLKLIHIRINTWTINYKDVVKSLREIEKAEKPVLVHCKHGSDRTGCVVAAWCMIKHNYTKEQAVNELRKGNYHFHEKYFKNIIRLINSLDVEKLKKDVYAN